MVMPRSRSMSIRSRYWARISRSATTPVSCSIRSASVDLPWSMWAMMQKFRICAGAVKVWSAKLLMGISWYRCGAGCFQRIERRPSRHNRAPVELHLCSGIWRPPWKTFQRFWASPRTWCSTRRPSSSANCSSPTPWRAASSRASSSAWTRSRAPPPRRPRDHGGPPGHRQQRSHRAPRPQARLRPRSRRPRRSGRDRLDLGGLRGRPDARQGPAGAGGGPGPQHAARPDAVQPGTSPRRPRLGRHRQRELGLRGQDELGAAGPRARRTRGGHPARRARSWTARSFEVVAARLRAEYAWS